MIDVGFQPGFASTLPVSVGEDEKPAASVRKSLEVDLRYLLGRQWLICYLSSGFGNAGPVLSPKPVCRQPPKEVFHLGARALSTRHVNSASDCLSYLRVCRRLKNITTKNPTSPAAPC